MDDFNQFILNTIIILSATSTIILVLEALGFLPHSISKYLIKNNYENVHVIKVISPKQNNIIKKNDILDNIPYNIIYNWSNFDEILQYIIKTIKG